MKKSICKLLSMVLVLSVITLSVSGCASNEKTVKSNQVNETSDLADEDVEGTVTFWHTYSANSEAKVFEKEIISDFNKKYPKIKIKSVTMPTENLKQQVLQAAANGTAPDVMRMDLSWVSQFANLGALVSVESMDGFDKIKSESYEASLNSCKWKEHYYGVPLDTNTQIAIYNKNTLSKAGLDDAPKTFEEFADAAKKLKNEHKNGLIGISGMGMWGMAPWFLSLGGKYCDEQYTKSEGYINSDKSVKALTKMVELNDAGVIGKCMLNGQPGTWEGLKSSKGYMGIADGPWFFTLQDDKILDNYIPTLIPTDISKSISVIGGEDLVMFQNSKNQRAAWIFMKYMTTEYPQKTLAEKVNQLPANTKVAQIPEFASKPIFKLYSEQMKNAWTRIPNPSIEEMDKKITLAFEKSFRHSGTVKDNLNILAKQLDELFAKNK